MGRNPKHTAACDARQEKHRYIPLDENAVTVLLNDACYPVEEYLPPCFGERDVP